MPLYLFVFACYNRNVYATNAVYKKGAIMDNENYIIALLIDTDNVSAKYMGDLEKELIVLGKITHKRMYGDFTKPNAEGWKEIVNDYSITPVQQYAYTSGKNVTDSKMIIDAMDILYSGTVNAICIMSSDSDFTGLAKRLKESNIYVIGAGEKKTPVSFVKACDRFFTLDNVEPKAALTQVDDLAKDSEPIAEQATVSKEEIEAFVTKIIEDAAKPCVLALVMQKIYQAYPQFDFKAFGVNKASKFFSKNKFTITLNKTTGTMIAIKEEKVAKPQGGKATEKR